MFTATLALTTLATWSISKAADTLWNKTEQQLHTVLNKGDLEAAIASGVTAATEWDSQQPHDHDLFYRYEESKQKQFKGQVFQDSGVLQELGKALQDQGKPDLAFLVERFKAVAAETNAPTVDSTVFI